MNLAEVCRNEYAAKKSRWDALIRQFGEMDRGEQREFVGKLIMLIEVEPPTPIRPSVIPISRDWAGKPRFSDLVRSALGSGGWMTTTEIFRAAKLIRPDTKMTSLATIISRMAKSNELQRRVKAGIKTYALKKSSTDS